MPHCWLISRLAREDAEKMRRYLKSRAVTVPNKVKKNSGGARWFEVKDPEGNRIRFIRGSAQPKPEPNAVSSQIIHAGFLVRDRAAEDKFYRDVLGFRPYCSAE